MSKIITFLVACTLISPAFGQTPAPAPAPTAGSLYKQGQDAEKAGDPVAAGNFYKSALKADPNNANIRYSLGQLKLNAADIATKGREAKFGAVMIPLFQLDGATLQEALEALSVIIEKESKNQVTPNFVVEDPKKLLATQKISLNLKNTPSRGVLKYLLDQTNARARYDDHAVVITAR